LGHNFLDRGIVEKLVLKALEELRFKSVAPLVEIVAADTSVNVVWTSVRCSAVVLAPAGENREVRTAFTAFEDSAKEVRVWRRP
jgi:hypothetical protein